MTHPLLEGTKDLARRFRKERRARPALTSEAFLDAERESPAYPAGIPREQWTSLLDALRNARDAEVDALIGEWLAQLPAQDAAATLPLDPGAQATLKTPEPPAEDAQVIDRRYRIVRVLGEGAFGKVFLVQDKLQNDHELALKLIKKEHTATSEALVRFKNEILLLRVLNHPGIPQIFNDGISEDGEFYYTMAYVSGRTLEDVIRKEAPLDPLRIVRITKQVLDVLEYAHARGAIHRDLKPGNIFLLHAGTSKEQVRVLDFGIAKVLSREGMLEHAQTMNTELPLGTPHYMSPEQVRGTEVDGRTDLYALGVILYQMCSGRFPFTGKTLLEILSARLERPPVPLADDATPAWLRELVMKLLERERDARPDTAAIRVMLDHLSGTQRSMARQLSWISGSIVVIAGVLGWYAFRGGEKAGTPATGGAPVEKPLQAHAPDPPSSESGKAETPPVPAPALDAEHKAEKPQQDQGAASALLDSDGDGTPDATDGCPNDKLKMAPGICGCGKPDIDSDGDGVMDCHDDFPQDRTRWSTAEENAAAAKAAARPEAQPPERKLVALPSGFSAEPGAQIDANGRAQSIVHAKTGIALELVELPAGKWIYLGRTEVTREQWLLGPTQVQATKMPEPPPGENSGKHPAVGMDLTAAKAFCEGLGMRLPATEEWDRAATLAGHAFPWGDAFEAGACNSNGAEDGFLKSAPVGSFQKDKCGPFLDMAGNVSEWCVDSGGGAALRGGSWKLAGNACKLTAKNTAPARGGESIGLRVALSCEP